MNEHYVTAMAGDTLNVIIACRCGWLWGITPGENVTEVWNAHRFSVDAASKQYVQ